VQLVGFVMNPALLMSTAIERSLSGMPWSIDGRSSEVIVRWASFGSTAIAARTTTVPRLNGPATAGTTIERPNGAPLYGPVR